MRKFSFVTGLILSVVGVLVIVANYLNGYLCSCPAQIVGQPYSCVCQPSSGFYFVFILGITLLIIGAVLLLTGLFRRQRPTLDVMGAKIPKSINFGSSHSGKAVSIGLAVLTVIVIASVAGFGIHLAASLKTTTNPSNSSTIASDSSAELLNTSTTYQDTSSFIQSLSEYSLHIPQFVFGVNLADVIPNDTLSLSPGTLIWETFTLNSTTSVSGINFEIIVPQTSLGSGNISGAYYLNGDMVSHVTYPLVGQVPSSVSNNNQQAPITTQEFSIVVNSVFNVGSNVTIALTAQSPVYLKIASGNGNSFLMQNVTAFPESVPLQFNSSEPLFFAWGSYA